MRDTLLVPIFNLSCEKKKKKTKFQPLFSLVMYGTSSLILSCTTPYLPPPPGGGGVLGIILKILGKLKIKPEVNGGFKVKYSIPLINVFNSLKGFRFKSNTQWCTNQNLIERFGMVINSLSALYSPPLSLPPQPPSTLNLTYIYRFKSNTQSHSLMSTTCRKEERKEKK